MKRIIFNLKWRWYAEIANGTKSVEYREVKPYWTKRLKNLLGKVPTKELVVYPHDLLAVFRCGYGRKHKDIVRRVMYVKVGSCPYKGWDGEYYRIGFEMRREMTSGASASVEPQTTKTITKKTKTIVGALTIETEGRVSGGERAELEAIRAYREKKEAK